MRRTVFLLSLMTMSYIVGFGCGGGAASPSTPAQVPIDIAEIAGTNNVSIDKAFQYTFEKPVDTSTVTATTFYLALASDPSTIITATISCSSSTVCTLTPSADLIEGTAYIIVLTADITYLDGTHPEEYSAEFTTTGEAPVTSCTASADCETGEICHYGTCKAYADVGVHADVACGDDGNATCVTAMGGVADEWVCLPLVDPADGSCSSETAYCIEVFDFFDEDDGYVDTEELCEAVDGFSWYYGGEDAGFICISDEILECIGAGGGGSAYSLFSINVDPLSYVNWVGIGDEDNWPIELDKYLTSCDEEYVRLSITKGADGEPTYCDDGSCIKLHQNTDAYVTISRTADSEQAVTRYFYITSQDMMDAIRATGPTASGDTFMFYIMSEDASSIVDTYSVDITFDASDCP